MKEKHSPETKKRLNELKETVESSVQKAKDIDKLRQDITSQRKNEVQIFYKGITENERISETAIDELSIVRRLINLRLILTLVIFVVFLLIYNVFLTPIIGSFRWNLIAVPTLLLVLSYFIVNHLALRPVKELLSSKVDKWKKSLHRTQSKTYRAIEENERKGFLTKLNAEVSRFIHVTTSFVPMVRQVEEALEHQHLCYRIVDSILACLKRYNIKTNLLTKLEKQLKEKPPIRLSKEEITAEYLQRLAKKVKYPLLALKLLFYDFSGDTELCRLTWQQIKSDNESIENLLRFLHENNIISLEEIETARAVNLVNSLDDFSIQKLRWGLKSLRLILELIEIVLDRAKREKLVERQIEVSSRIVPDTKINLFVENLTDESAYSILTVVGSAIDRNLEQNKDAVVKSLMVLSSAESIVWLRKISNETAGMDTNSVDMLFIYQILKEERRGQVVTLRDAATIPKTYLEGQKEKRKPQRDTFEIFLKNGKWIDSIQYLNVETLRQVEKEIGEMTEEKDKLKAIKEVSKYFLSQNTIMQVLESRTLMAYIILAKTKIGIVMPIVDEIKDYARNDIFWFKKYTTAARIGIVPPGMTFKEFCDAFEENFPVDSKELISNIVIHRFPVSEFSSRQISMGETYDPPWVLLRDLIVEHISPQKLRIYLRYCELINESFWKKSFHEIIRDYLIDSMPDKFEYLIGKLTEKKPLPSICAEFGKKDLRDLVNHIMLSEDQEKIKKKINEILLRILQPLDDETILRISNAFYRRLHNFGIVARSISIGIHS